MGIYRGEHFAVDVKSIKNVMIDYDSCNKTWDIFIIGDIRHPDHSIFTDRIKCGTKEKAEEMFDKLLRELEGLGWGKDG